MNSDEYSNSVGSGISPCEEDGRVVWGRRRRTSFECHVESDMSGDGLPTGFIRLRNLRVQEWHSSCTRESDNKDHEY